MMNVNKVFGVIMLGVAIWMISRVIPNNITTILWAILFIGSGLYLNPFEKIENYKDTILKTIGFILIIVGGSLIFKSINPPISSPQTQQWKIIKNIKDLENIQGDAIVDFTAKWCVSCKEYEEITFKDKRVIDKLKSYNLYRVDVTNNTNFDRKIMKKFSIVGPPAILIFKDRKLIKKIIGYKPPDEFLKAIDS
jgi:thiol:disulfide interchange protein DsbD